MRKISFLLLALSLMLIASCGKKGPMKLPGADKVPKLEVKEALASGGIIRILWDPVGEPAGVKKYILYRSAGEGKFAKIAEIGHIENSQEACFFKEQSGLKEGEWYHYVIAAMGEGDSLMRISDTVDIFYSIEPSPPSEINYVVGETYIQLRWNAPLTRADGAPVSDISGYNIYRKREDQNYFRPVNATLITKNSFFDMLVKKDNVYSYIVKAVDNYYPPWHESQPSEVIKVDFADRLPPDTPSELKAIGSGGRISLSWQKGLSGDLAGYRLYRGTAENGEYEMLNKEIMRDEYFEDIHVDAGVEYFYKVKAVDNSKAGNESAFSNVAAGRAF